jgi:hypothetical protein
MESSVRLKAKLNAFLGHEEAFKIYATTPVL